MQNPKYFSNYHYKINDSAKSAKTEIAYFR